VHVVGADPFDDAVGLEDGEDRLLDAREAQRDSVDVGELGELGQLRGSLGVDESTPSRSSTTALTGGSLSWVIRRSRSCSASAVAATAASDELGPVEIWRDVPKSA
jgi:hypothetical protein